MGIAQHIVQPFGFSERLLRDQPYGGFWTFLDTLGLPAAAEIAFDWIINIAVSIHGTEGAGFHAFHTGNAEILVQMNDPITSAESINRTCISAYRYFALAAHNRHSYNRMGVGNKHSDGTLFRIIDLEMVVGAGQLANSTTGTEFRDNS